MQRRLQRRDGAVVDGDDSDDVDDSAGGADGAGDVDADASIAPLGEEAGDGASAGAGDARMPQETIEAIREGYGPFTPEAGWQARPAPADTEELWLAQMKKMKKNCSFWKGKRIAHIFSNGWAVGTFSHRETYRRATRLVFLYRDPPPYQAKWYKYGHSLELEDHGVSALWVILEKA